MRIQYYGNDTVRDWDSLGREINIMTIRHRYRYLPTEKYKFWKLVFLEWPNIRVRHSGIDSWVETFQDWDILGLINSGTVTFWDWNSEGRTVRKKKRLSNLSAVTDLTTWNKQWRVERTNLVRHKTHLVSGAPVHLGRWLLVASCRSVRYSGLHPFGG